MKLLCIISICCLLVYFGLMSSWVAVWITIILDTLLDIVLKNTERVKDEE